MFTIKLGGNFFETFKNTNKLIDDTTFFIMTKIEANNKTR